MSRPASSVLLAAFISLLCVSPAAAQSDDWRTIEFETREVTDADVTVSPDGRSLVFTILGHLFRLPVEGGRAKQLTFGPYYDSDPVFSPDGSRVAFVSDRDGSEGNIFVIDLATEEIAQVTQETWAGRPAWTPDGGGIVYLLLLGVTGWCPSGEAQVQQIQLDGGDPRTLSTEPSKVRSVFYTRDGRLGRAVVTGEEDTETRIDVMTAEGEFSGLTTVVGAADRVIPAPTVDAFYARRQIEPMAEAAEVVFASTSSGVSDTVTTVSRHYCHFRHPRFDVSSDGQSLFLGDKGRLWRAPLPSGELEPIDFTARVQLRILDPTPPPKVLVGGVSYRLRSILDPRLSPDGGTLVFGALGYLWEHSLSGGPARRLTEDPSFERHPAFSPDGRRVAFLRGKYGTQQVRVLDLETKAVSTVASGPFFWHPSWSPDGRKLVFAEWDPDGFYIMAVDLPDGEPDTLARTGRSFSPRPHFSADGRWLIYRHGHVDLRYGPVDTASIRRLRLADNAEPEVLVRLSSGLGNALVSPDGGWLAFRRNTELWLASLRGVASTAILSEKDARRLSYDGGEHFAFTPGGSSLIYSEGDRVWIHSLDGGRREEVPIRLDLDPPSPPPLVLRGVRVLDFTSGGFGPETSLLIDQGRIRWIGRESEHPVPPNATTVDAGGRFAIPGLWDLHTHAGWLVEADQEAYIAYGVTSVRDLGGRMAWVAALHDRSALTSDPVPRYFYSGYYLIQLGLERGLLIEDEADARPYVRRLKNAGVHFIKPYAILAWPLQRAVAEEARRVGLPVAAHGTHVQEVTRGVTWGFLSLEHNAAPNRYYDDVFQLLAAAGTRWAPTLAIMAGHAALREWWSGSRSPEPDSPLGRAFRGLAANALADIQTAHRRDVRLLLATDAPGYRGDLPGTALHREMEVYALAGLSPLEVLRIATQEAAEALGAGDDLGSIEEGKLADIVLLDANPLDDIKNTHTIWRVIKGGWVFDPEKLRPPASTDGET